MGLVCVSNNKASRSEKPDEFVVLTLKFDSLVMWSELDRTELWIIFSEKSGLALEGNRDLFLLVYVLLF